MRITHIINSLQTGGAEVLLAGITSRQLKMGHRVRVISIKNQNEVGLNLGVELVNLNLKKYDLRALIKIARLTQEDDIIHAHLAPAHYFAVSAGIKRLIVTEHNTYNRRWDFLLFRLLDRLIYNRINNVIAISGAVKEKLVDFGVKRDRVRVIHNGIDRERIQELSNMIENLEIPETAQGRPLIGMVSRFSHQKDYKAVIELAYYMPDVYFVLIGDGETKTSIESLVKERGINNVFFAGRMTNPFPIIKRFTLGLQLSHWEGFGIAALEMMSLGIPVIMSDVPGLREFNSKEPRMKFYSNAEETSHYIRSIIQNEITLKELKNWVRIIAESYDLNNTVLSYMELYEECCKCE